MTSSDDDSGQRGWLAAFLSVVSDWATTLRVALLVLLVAVLIWVLSLDVRIGPFEIGSR